MRLDIGGAGFSLPSPLAGGSLLHQRDGRLMKTLERPVESQVPDERMPISRPVRRGRARVTVRVALLGICALAFVVFLLLPLYAIFWRSLPHGALFNAIGLPIVRDALRLSLITTAIALGMTIVLG